MLVWSILSIPVNKNHYCLVFSLLYSYLVLREYFKISISSSLNEVKEKKKKKKPLRCMTIHVLSKIISCEGDDYSSLSLYYSANLKYYLIRFPYHITENSLNWKESLEAILSNPLFKERPSIAGCSEPF